MFDNEGLSVTIHDAKDQCATDSPRPQKLLSPEARVRPFTPFRYDWVLLYIYLMWMSAFITCNYLLSLENSHHLWTRNNVPDEATYGSQVTVLRARVCSVQKSFASATRVIYFLYKCTNILRSPLLAFQLWLVPHINLYALIYRLQSLNHVSSWWAHVSKLGKGILRASPNDSLSLVPIYPYSIHLSMPCLIRRVVLEVS